MKKDELIFEGNSIEFALNLIILIYLDMIVINNNII